MGPINIKRQVADSLDHGIERITKALAMQGFGVLTRIDLHTKIKDKTGHDVVPTVILGACNPNLAYEAYSINTDVAGLLPCNVVVREVSAGMLSIECALPSSMMRALGDDRLTGPAAAADVLIQRALDEA